MKQRLEEIKRRLDKVTQGPWRINQYREVEARNKLGCFRPLIKLLRQTCGPKRVYSFPTSDNAEFIAHAREDIPWLVEQIEMITSSSALLPTPLPPVSEKPF